MGHLLCDHKTRLINGSPAATSVLWIGYHRYSPNSAKITFLRKSQPTRLSGVATTRTNTLMQRMRFPAAKIPSFTLKGRPWLA
jgi:hypothetical protein